MKEKVQKGFSRFERNGIILLVLLILLSVIFKNFIVFKFKKEDEPISKADIQKFEKLKQQIAEAKTSYTNSTYKANYNKPNAYGYTYTTANNSNTGHKKKDHYDFMIEVNSATNEDYERLYGIGKVYADRIVKFRDKLGGFYSINQIKDVFGIEDSTFQKFKKNLTIKPVKINKININTATFEELTANPYFFSTVAKQIIGYRTKVKPFATADDIKNLYFVKDHPEHYDKMLPYVTTD